MRLSIIGAAGAIGRSVADAFYASGTPVRLRKTSYEEGARLTVAAVPVSPARA